RAVAAIAGSGLLVAAAVLYGLDVGGPEVAGAGVAVWAAGLSGAAALVSAWRRG
ncbi:MAG: phosphate ABC transporter, permease protein PstA, partial [Gammaproteobacteria bacterium]|nr:phosphate ABC transporter, permease protein PstA [Gammaproteobacteria bacterium]